MNKYKPMKIEEDPDLKKIKSHPEEWQKETHKVKVIVDPPYTIKTFSSNNNSIKTKDKIIKNIYQNDFNPFNVIMISNNYYEARLNNDITSHSEKSFTYNPFEVNFVEEIINLKMNKESIINFINKYGLLETDYHYKRKEYIAHLGHPFSQIYQYFYITPLIEDFRLFYYNIVKIKYLFKLWKNFKDNEFVKENLFDLVKIYYEAPKQQIEDLKMNCNKKECKEIYFSLIIHEINKELKKQNIVPYIQTGKDFSLIPGYTAPNLFSVLYIQFFQMVTQEKSYKKCLYCGSYFIPQSKNKIDKFCPDDNNEEKHSICNVRYNSMKNKNIINIIENKLNESKVRKLASNIKWTDREDKTHYGRPYREVKNWIEEYTPRTNKTKNLYKEYMNSDKCII